mmetsp:Transcript_4065/g.11396  ORF Transcript_4065/g.11396 Transcript_4065/m.11396 type:complete len:152 (-) Transcript_4065:328-783(-)
MAVDASAEAGQFGIASETAGCVGQLQHPLAMLNIKSAAGPAAQSEAGSSDLSKASTSEHAFPDRSNLLELGGVDRRKDYGHFVETGLEKARRKLGPNFMLPESSPAAWTPTSLHAEAAARRPFSRSSGGSGAGPGAGEGQGDGGADGGAHD